MKRFVLLLLCFLFCMPFLSGCAEEKQDSGKLSIVCTIFPQYDFVRQIAGDLVDLKMLVPCGMESHDFSLENMSVADIKTVAEADMIIYVGGEGDIDWITELKNTVPTDGLWLPLISMTDLLPTADSDSMEEHHHEHGEECEDEHVHEYDEHVWTSPKRAMDIVEVLTGKLCELDAKNAEIYRANSEAYIRELQELDKDLENISADGKQLIFADRFPFRYLCADYGLAFDAAFSGCSSDTDPSVAQINSLCESAASSNASVIFHVENSNTVYAEGIAENVGAKALLLHSCHNVSRVEFKNGVTYVSLMKNNILSISEALG